MPRSRNDPHKRKCAQALNHLAAAILDMHDVYKVFDEKTESMKEVNEDIEMRPDPTTIERYEKLTEELKVMMMGSAAVREHLIMFVGDVWQLDEESIKVYMG